MSTEAPKVAYIAAIPAMKATAIVDVQAFIAPAPFPSSLLPAGHRKGPKEIRSARAQDATPSADTLLSAKSPDRLLAGQPEGEFHSIAATGESNAQHLGVPAPQPEIPGVARIRKQPA
jgi:hypothetical protein